jgi:ADP-ribose pyrophosphatase YjhB (NUDIX family)
MFNVRVYGLWINAADEILLVKEKYKGIDMVKFPGGGLDFGEGTIDCIIREFKEETGVTIENPLHFYTTDFFIQSAFHTDKQLISIYYRVFGPEPVPEIVAKETDHDFFWTALAALTPEMVTFPVDRHVVQLLKTANLK